MDKSADEDGTHWADVVRPLTENIVNNWLQFLPKLVYPIRVGEHTNTAFGLTLALDYATKAFGDEEGGFVDLIKHNSSMFYIQDKYETIVTKLNFLTSVVETVLWNMNQVAMISCLRVFRRWI